MRDNPRKKPQRRKPARKKPQKDPWRSPDPVPTTYQAARLVGDVLFLLFFEPNRIGGGFGGFAFYVPNIERQDYEKFASLWVGVKAIDRQPSLDFVRRHGANLYVFSDLIPSAIGPGISHTRTEDFDRAVLSGVIPALETEAEGRHWPMWAGTVDSSMRADAKQLVARIPPLGQRRIVWRLDAPKQNPFSETDIRDLCPGVDLLDRFEQDYPESARGTLRVTPADRLYHGRNVIWRGTEGEMIRMGKDYLRPMDGNIWDPCKLAGIAAALQEWPEKVVLDPGYGTPSVIGLTDVKESIEYEDEETLTTGDEELDRYLVDPDEVLAEYEDEDEAREDLDERLQEAVDNDEGDLGAITFQVRNGNHRTFGALLAGEPYVWLIVDSNTQQDLERHPEREDNQRIIDALE